jgi:hypothetical protein
MATVIATNGATTTKVESSGITRKHLLPLCPVDYIGVDYKIDLQEIKQKKYPLSMKLAALETIHTL